MSDLHKLARRDLPEYSRHSVQSQHVFLHIKAEAFTRASIVEFKIIRIVTTVLVYLVKCVGTTIQYLWSASFRAACSAS